MIIEMKGYLLRTVMCFSFLLILSLDLAAQDGLSITTEALKETHGLSFQKSLKLENVDERFEHYLFYEEMDVPAETKGHIAIKNGAIVSLKDGHADGFILISAGGTVVSRFGPLYDFSETGYSQIDFKGWLFVFRRGWEFTGGLPVVSLQLATKDGRRVPADPLLPYIIYESAFGYPVTIEIYPYPEHAAMWRENKIITIARRGLPENAGSEVYEWLDKLTPSRRRLMRNALFALYGYQFKTPDLQSYFSGLKWYKRNPTIRNSMEILTKDQRRLLNYLLRK